MPTTTCCAVRFNRIDGAAAATCHKPHDHDAALALNNAHSNGLSLLDADGLTALLAMAWHARIAAPADGLLLALDQDAPHAAANFGGGGWLIALHALCMSIAS